MHPRNRHPGRYPLQALAGSSPELLPFITVNEYGSETIDFSNPKAVRALNRAILKHDYGVLHWDIPEKFLCPPIPGRADYIHYMADLIKAQGPQVRVLDIGTGANCIYPLIGNKEYGWSFVGSDIESDALEAATKIIKANQLQSFIELRKQPESSNMFKGIIARDDKFHLTVCNPPFHESEADAIKGTQRKLKNLGLKAGVLNFGGKSSELWCQGGELSFVSTMIEESFTYRDQCDWFSSLISKESNLPKLQKQLRRLKAVSIEKIEMSQGQKKSRVLAWTWREVPH
ncbi:MAG TPA: 23S rRNA (adenine(1618)-N(6))-methyltransferase RlmF [Bacteriovoracaceae bacterium]|nr:23S rRNA (adenine(1618)-N(6))-methyltransferase RlmF [Bacteriovoracaceae bacterium]